MLLSFVTGLLAALLLTAPLAILLARRSARQAQRLERRTRQAQRLAELATLTGGLAHEIRNPLSTLRLNLDLLAEQWKDASPEEFDDLTRRSVHKLAMLRRETERLDDILEDFLRYAGLHQLQIAPADMNRVVGELLEFYSPQAAAAHIQIRSGLSAEPLPVRIDANLFKQAVLNLLINAQQAMIAPSTETESVASGPGRGEPGRGEPGRLGPGSSSASASGPSSGYAPTGGLGGELLIRTYRAGPDACLDIADTGPGIDPDRLDKIFEAYYSTKRGGTGLGLPTTRRIVEEHAGRIEVHSEPGRGTSFTIRLPLAEE